MANSANTIQEFITNLKTLETKFEEIKPFLSPDDCGINWLDENKVSESSEASQELKELVNKIIYDLNGFLILSNGQNNSFNRLVIKKAGFSFAKGEEDSFGPLTSVIVLKDFRICYG